MKSQVTIEYMGILADKRGIREEVRETHAANFEELFEELLGDQLGAIRSSIKPVRNDEIVLWTDEISSGDRVAFLPPMSGG